MMPVSPGSKKWMTLSSKGQRNLTDSKVFKRGRELLLQFLSMNATVLLPAGSVKRLCGEDFPWRKWLKTGIGTEGTNRNLFFKHYCWNMSISIVTESSVNGQRHRIGQQNIKLQSHCIQSSKTMLDRLHWYRSWDGSVLTPRSALLSKSKKPRLRVWKISTT